MTTERTEAARRDRPRAQRTLTGYAYRGLFCLSLAAGFCLALAVANGWRPWASPVPKVDKSRVTRASGDKLAPAARRAARSVVSIQTVGQANTRNLGAGFVVEGGLIATNFHVVSSATEAQARFADGRVFAIAGYAAADPAHDLALLRLAAPPSDVVPLAFATVAPPPATQLMAIGHPRGVEFAFVEGRLSQRVNTGDLPRDAQRFVRKLASDADTMRWLQHTATLAEGNSGGPLIDAQGQVVGVNTWINREQNINYAIEPGYVVNVLSAVTDATQPLAELARTDLQASLVVSRLTASRVAELSRQAKEMRWLPASASDYRVLSELALAITAAHLPQSFQGDKLDEARVRDLQTAVLGLERELAEQADFGSPDQMTFVNEEAAKVIARPATGLFFFATVERVVEGERGQRGMLLTLVGHEQPLFISLDGQLATPKSGQTLAIFGVNLQGEVVRYGDNPLRLISAPTITSRTFLEIK